MLVLFLVIKIILLTISVDTMIYPRWESRWRNGFLLDYDGWRRYV